ncbi:MAG TPA: PIN domain-containing protein [Roseiflexaceae bacterium]|nr:PIN domain-containing protein [Roseiflexaceae bacterium]
MRYLVDTNVILRFVNRRDPLHTTMRVAVRKLRQDGHQLCIAPQNCVEFWNVATRPTTQNGYGLSTSEADTALRLIERLFPLLPEQPTVYAEWRKLVVQFSVSGVQVHDARLVATMLSHSINHMITANTDDFTRYTSIGIVAVHPTHV